MCIYLNILRPELTVYHVAKGLYFTYNFIESYFKWHRWQLVTSGSGNISHWGRVTHICVGELTIIVSDNGLSPGRRQAIIWTNAGILLIGPYGTNFSEILIEILTFSFTKMGLKVSPAKWRPFCLGLNVLSNIPLLESAVTQFTRRLYASSGLNDLTHWGRYKMDAISQTAFSSAFSWMKMHEFRLRFHWSFFLRFELTIFQHWFRQWLGAGQATSHYLNQWWIIY